jgi:hypothetical protein
MGQGPAHTAHGHTGTAPGRGWVGRRHRGLPLRPHAAGAPQTAWGTHTSPCMPCRALHAPLAQAQAHDRSTGLGRGGWGRGAGGWGAGGLGGWGWGHVAGPWARHPYRLTLGPLLARAPFSIPGFLTTASRTRRRHLDDITQPQNTRRRICKALIVLQYTKFDMPWNPAQGTPDCSTALGCWGPACSIAASSVPRFCSPLVPNMYTRIAQPAGTPDYYTILGVDDDAPPGEVRTWGISTSSFLRGGGRNRTGCMGL